MRAAAKAAISSEAPRTFFPAFHAPYSLDMNTCILALPNSLNTSVKNSCTPDALQSYGGSFNFSCTDVELLHHFGFGLCAHVRIRIALLILHSLTHLTHARHRLERINVFVFPLLFLSSSFLNLSSASFK